MAIIGWAVIVVFTTWLTGVFLIVAFNTLGKYNIGGVPTTIQGKVFTVMFGLVVAYVWVIVAGLAPFSIK